MFKRIKSFFHKKQKHQEVVKEQQEKKKKINTLLYDEEIKRAKNYVNNIVAPTANNINPQGAFDSADCFDTMKADSRQYLIEPHQFNWYASQSFIGFNAMAVIGQNEMISSICDIKAKDALRKGYVISNRNENLSNDVLDRLEEIEEKFKIDEKLRNQIYFTQIFGIRIAVFDVYSSDPDYYSKPFNIDGVKEGSYKGIKQIDPYFCMPILDDTSISNVASLNFYEPEYWLIGGTTYHKSHLVITRGEEVADLIKPSYQYAGLSLTQKIYRKLYNAERTADEVPALVMSKRTNIFKSTDFADMVTNLKDYMTEMKNWLSLKDNFAMQVIGKDDEVVQLETSLSDLDAVIMTNYQLVCSTAHIPSYKLMGTSLKGFSGGETEESSYHEELESQQKFVAKPLLQRHLDLVNKSEFDGQYNFRVRFNEIDSVNESERATINQAKATVLSTLVGTSIISQQEAAKILNEDKDSYLFGKLEFDEVEEEEDEIIGEGLNIIE